MISKTGKSIVKGIAIGKIFLFEKKEYLPVEEKIENTDAEINRFHDAQAKAIDKLKELYDTALKSAGEEQAMIFDVHQMMLEDADYVESITNMIQDEKVNAEYAVTETGKSFAEIFSSMDDEYMKARSCDVLDISKQVVSILSGIEQDLTLKEPVILVANDLSPSETVQFDKSKILAFVTRKGSSNSHTAILARSMNIPSLIHSEIELSSEFHGKLAIVDGFTGSLYIEPEEDLLVEMKKQQSIHLAQIQDLEQLKGQENITLSGQKINLYANIGSVEDTDTALLHDAGGIGLFRSEFIYLGRNELPSEEEQYEIYKSVITKMNGKKVIIRTLDIGADKQADYLHLEKEENPAMGYRAIRICLQQAELFRAQLRAIYRASAYGTASIMFPMIISLTEIRLIKDIIKKVQEELVEEGKPTGKVELGIMIETPAAVMISDLLAKEVDFFSIGTNDLTQYTLAIDRQNQNLDSIYNPHHEAILRMIRMTIENGHQEGIWVGICGELAADEALTETFAEMGVDELSVSPSRILSLRKKIREIK